MSNRRLVRVTQLHKELCKLLENNRITKCKDVLSHNVIELMNIVHSYAASLSLLNTVANIVAPKPSSALDLFQSNSCRFLSTSLARLDEIMHGGIHVGTITELTGPPGCGKTQFSMMMSAVTALDFLTHNNDNCIVYIDTENAFSPTRLQEITLHKMKELAYENIDVSNVASKVLVFLESTFQSLHQRLLSLEGVIITKKVKLIILDSIASLARKEFSHHTVLNERNNMLIKQATILKYYAETFNIPVLVTNQITKSNDSSELTEDWSVVPALGNTWAHAVNSRLMVKVLQSDKINKSVKEMCLVKSPVAPPLKVKYEIGPQGIILVGGDNNNSDFNP